MNIESSLYRELTQDELARVLSSALQTAAIEYRLLSGGLFNTTYFVKTATKGDIVLRVGPVNRHLLLSYEHRLMEIEAQVYDICASYGIPTSALLAIDTSKRLIDRDFMIVRYIPGCTFAQLSEESAHRGSLLCEFGAAVARMHAVTAPRFGRIDTVTAGGGYARWSDFLLAEIDDWMPSARSAALMSEDELSRLRRIYAGHVPLLDEITTPRLVHTDLGPGNVLIRTDGECPAFAAIIDPDRAFWGDPAFDFCQITWMLGDDFLRGYGSALPGIVPEDPRSLRRRKLYRALRLCWDAYVWEMEYHQHEYMLSSMAIVRRILYECERSLLI